MTQALFRPNVSGDYTNGLADLLDVIGTNYRDSELLAARRARPSRKIIGTEQRQDRADLAGVPGPSRPRRAIPLDGRGLPRRIAPVAGHRGGVGPARPLRPAAPGGLPAAIVVVGQADGLHRPPPPGGTDGIRDPGFTPLDRRQEVFSDWTPRDGTPHEETVEVYSNCGEVDLLLNGRSLGSRPLQADASPRVWQVPFQPGELVAIGKNNGRAAASHTLRTAGAPAKIVLTADEKQLARRMGRPRGSARHRDQRERRAGSPAPPT